MGVIPDGNDAGALHSHRRCWGCGKFGIAGETLAKSGERIANGIAPVGGLLDRIPGWIPPAIPI